MQSRVNASPTSLGFRPDIEGLRAIAILLVVAAHAKVPGLAGGFIGVDVFFVLSGYLITALLVGEYLENGRVDFVAFYARRFRRLLPALLVMLLFSSIAALFILSSAEQIAQGMAAASAALWLSNFHFAFVDLDYFGGDAEKNLFLHTWSLGVEEQFYLVWPFLIALVFAVSRRLARGAEIRFLKWSMAAVLVLSFVASLCLLERSPALAFYMMPPRAWQFSLGALAWLHFRSELVNSPRLMFGLGWLGLGLIFFAALLLDNHTVYPGLWSLLPSLGAAMVLVGGAAQVSNGAGRWLGINMLQFIGRVSYSWYLWHWPILLLGGAFLLMENLASRVVLIVISLGFAVFSFRFVEAPVRVHERLAAIPRFVAYGALVLMIGAHLLSVHWQNMAISWLDSPENLRFTTARADRPVIYEMGCDDWYRSSKVQFCAFGSEGAPRTVLLMGDSIGAQWFPAVAKVFEDIGWRLLVLTKSGCPMVDERVFSPRLGRDYAECAEWREQALERVVAVQPDMVLLGSMADYPFTQEQWVEGTRRVLAKLSPAVGEIYLIRSTPRLPFDGPDCLALKYASPLKLNIFDNCADAAPDARDDVWGYLIDAAKTFENIRLIDVSDAVCPGRVCSAELGGVIVFRDNRHLTADFTARLATVLAGEMYLGAQ